MNIGAQFKTQTGNIYIADVVNQKIMLIKADGEKGDWRAYSELEKGQVGQSLIVHWPKEAKRKPLKTTEVVALEFPKIGE